MTDRPPRRCGRPRRRAVAPLLAMLVLLGACATVSNTRQAPASGDALSGRMTVRVEPAGSVAAARSVSAVFELSGDAQRGELALSTPLGTLLARARWQPGNVTLATPQGETRHIDLDALTRSALGEPLRSPRCSTGCAGGRGPMRTACRRGHRPMLASPARLGGRPVAVRRRRAGRRPAAAATAGDGARQTGPAVTAALRAIHDVPAPAKLNLFLHVVGRRADGYHLLQSVFVLIDWCDTLHFETRDDGRLARHDLNRTAQPLPADDLCLRAARALQLASRLPARRRHHARQAAAERRRHGRRQF